eukprot:5452217-Pyramimonas_sp.AAC.1
MEGGRKEKRRGEDKGRGEGKRRIDDEEAEEDDGATTKGPSQGTIVFSSLALDRSRLNFRANPNRASRCLDPRSSRPQGERWTETDERKRMTPERSPATMSPRRLACSVQRRPRGN